MDQVKLPQWLGGLFPFKIKTLKVDDYNLRYVDEGKGPVVVLLHGNPTWSFYYRNLIKGLKKNYRVIVPDHLGCGLSDKPQNYPYDLNNHIQNIVSLLKKLEVQSFRLIVHDWGGAIGMGVATRDPAKVERLVLLNTAAFTSERIPKRIQICRQGKLGEFLVRRLNGFALPATFMTTVKPLPKNVKQAYLYPYQDYANRVAVSRFVQDIPMEVNHPSRTLLESIESKLPAVSCPKLILWGGKDFCFNTEFFDRWKKIYPEAKSHLFKDAGHYILEDKPEESLQKIQEFLA